MTLAQKAKAYMKAYILLFPSLPSINFLKPLNPFFVTESEIYESKNKKDNSIF